MKSYLKYLVILTLSVCLVLNILQIGLAQEKATTGQYSTLKDFQRYTGQKITGFKEAPMLTELVKQGKLPSVEKRLPEEPAVIVPVERIGEYGGTWKRCWTGVADSAGPSRINYTPTLRWSEDGKKIEPNVAKGWNLSKDCKELTLYFRKGMRWSDGEPFTADDVLFWFEDVILNKELTPVQPTWMVLGGSTKIEKLDSYTVKFTFSNPNPLILQWFTGVEAFLPKHYLKSFHPKYVSKTDLEALTKKEGFQFWYQLFGAKNDWISNPERPTHKAWKPTNLPSSTLWIMERNPYYWKVDTAGNQLPYIDRVAHTLVSDAEMVTMKAISGEIDMQLRHILINNYPLLVENSKKGDYRVIVWNTGDGSNCQIMFNQNHHEDEDIGELIRNKNFRIALSLAINRDEINQLCYLGLGQPRQATVIPSCPTFEEKFAKAYVEYDPKRANEMLDKIGLKRGKDGFRTLQNGKMVALTIEIVSAFGPYVDAAELIKKYWEAVGVKTAIQVQERSLHYTRIRAGLHQVAIWNMDGAFYPQFLTYPYWFLPYGNDSRIAPLSGVWYQTGGKGGEEPKGDLKRAILLYDEAIKTTNPAKRLTLAKEIIRLHSENLWTIGTVGLAPATMGIGVVKNNFRNVPEKALSDVTLNSPSNTHPEQYFFEK